MTIHQVEEYISDQGKKCLNFGTDPDLDLDQGLFFSVFNIGRGAFLT